MSKASDTQVGGDHYKTMGDFQPWDVLQHWLTPEEYRGYQKGVAIAYLARERQKGGDQDIKKAAHHLQRLIEAMGGDPLVQETAQAALAMDEPDADGWIPWHGGKCPVDRDQTVEIKRRDGTTYAAHGEYFRWVHASAKFPEFDRNYDIIAYRVVPTNG